VTALQAIYPLVPQRYKNTAKHIAALANRVAGAERMMPSFLIIGAQKAGTSSLFKYLMRHGSYLRPLLKDVYYFDNNFERGTGWYQSFFPSAAACREREREQGGPVITGEGATYYLLHPLVPQRVRTSFPNMKLIVLLRDPVERAMSHYFHNRRFGAETASTPEEAFALEASRLDGELERLQQDPSYRSHAFQSFSYLARGRYAEQLERWLAEFPREQIHIECSERFYGHTDDSFRRVCRFLEIAERSLEAYAVEGRGWNREEDADARAFAREHFRAPNERLFDLLGERLPWSS
jgi:hypothetical protein